MIEQSEVFRHPKVIDLVFLFCFLYTCTYSVGELCAVEHLEKGYATYVVFVHCIQLDPMHKYIGTHGYSNLPVLYSMRRTLE